MKVGKCGGCNAAWWLLLVGGLNWGLVGLFDWNLVEVVFGSWPWLVKIVYILVGLSALMALMGNACKMCKKKK